MTESDEINGFLVVLEGPDGVGKTTLANRLAARMSHSRRESVVLSFPGRERGTLGRLIYDLHHRNADVSVKNVSELALQTLHVAAHVDTIVNRIIPALKENTVVFLDRFWWSTWVYGVASGLGQETMDALVAFENKVWNGIAPDVIFLVKRDTPIKANHSRDTHQQLVQLYEELSQRTAIPGLVHLDNDGPIERTLMRAVSAAETVLGDSGAI